MAPHQTRSKSARSAARKTAKAFRPLGQIDNRKHSSIFNPYHRWTEKNPVGMVSVPPCPKYLHSSLTNKMYIIFHSPSPHLNIFSSPTLLCNILHLSVNGGFHDILILYLVNKNEIYRCLHVYTSMNYQYYFNHHYWSQ